MRRWGEEVRRSEEVGREEVRRRRSEEVGREGGGKEK